jgi:ATP synthase protein I
LRHFLDSAGPDQYGPRGFAGGGHNGRLESVRVEAMNDDTHGAGDHHEPPDDEAALSARLQRLGERLAIANRPSENGSGPRQTADASAFARGFRLSSELVGAVLVGAGAGWLIDRWLGTTPWGLIVFLLLGFAAGVLNVMRAAGVVRERSLND